jgi:hypothetical protein
MLMCKWQRVVTGMTKLLQKTSKWRWTKTAKLCKSISDSSEKVWAKNWHIFISNFDQEILQWRECTKKKIARVSHVFDIKNF